MRSFDTSTVADCIRLEFTKESDQQLPKERVKAKHSYLGKLFRRVEMAESISCLVTVSGGINRTKFGRVG